MAVPGFDFLAAADGHPLFTGALRALVIKPIPLSQELSDRMSL
jgi:hypothetical protein